MYSFIQLLLFQKIWSWMAREQNSDCESIKIELWNSPPAQITFAISTCLLDNSPERWKRICFDEVCGAYSDLYFSALTINLLTYLLPLQKKQLKQYIISCKTVADVLKITVLNTKPLGCRGLRPLTPTGGSAPWTPDGGSAPRPPL